MTYDMISFETVAMSAIISAVGAIGLAIYTRLSLLKQQERRLIPVRVRHDDLRARRRAR
ncbi:MAG: hypothetical protein JKY17_04430 [Magnetovibrio sp.]|nr:hypothetical protein [Magnetovibrio sp.]